MSSRRASPVWKVFERIDGKTARCKICNHPYSTSGGTSNLRDHIRRRHPEEDQADPNAGIPCYSRNSEVSQDIDRFLALFIAKEFEPFCIVESDSFRKLLRRLDPRYQLPCRRTISEVLIPRLQGEVRDKLREALQGVRWVSLTTDSWTSNRQESYIAVTAHFVHAGRLTSGCLDVAVLDKSHTAECLAAHLRGVMRTWQIVGKVAAFTTDNAANIKNAVRIMKIPHLSCVAHTLHLVVCGAINPVEELGKILAKCGEIVSHFKHSTLASNRLRSLQSSARTSQLRLIQQVPTRWNSKLAMVRRLLEVKDHLIIAQSQLCNAPQALNAEEWKVLEDFVAILQPFEEVTTTLSAAQYVTASQIIPMVYGLFSSLEGRVAPSSPTGEIFRQEVVREVTERLFAYESSSFLAQVATFLDPRFKKLGFMVQAKGDEVSKLVEAEVRNVLRRGTPSPVKENNSTPHWEDHPLYGFVSRRISEIHATPTSDAAILLRRYNETPPEPSTMNPISFWEGQEEGLKDVAQKYLCVPATSVPCERLFSDAGQIITDRRSNLSASKASALIFIKGNESLLN